MRVRLGRDLILRQKIRTLGCGEEYKTRAGGEISLCRGSGQFVLDPQGRQARSY